LHRCCPAVSEATFYTFDQAKIAPSTAAATTILALRSSIRCQLRRPAHPLSKPPPRQIPIDGKRPHGPPRVPSWGAFGRRPSVRADRSPRAGIRNPSPTLPFGRLLIRTYPSRQGFGRAHREDRRISCCVGICLSSLQAPQSSQHRRLQGCKSGYGGRPEDIQGDGLDVNQFLNASGA
jgi:hypothetical protein